MNKTIIFLIIFILAISLFIQPTSCYSQSNYGTQITFDGGRKYQVDWSPDGKWLTYSLGLIADDIYIISSAGGESINLTSNINDECAMPTFTPDSKNVIFTNINSQSIESINIETLEYTIFEPNGTYGFWSNSGKYFGYLDGGKRIVVRNVENDQETVLTSKDQISKTWSISCFSPDDSHIIYIKESDSKLYKIPLAGGDSEQISFESGPTLFQDYSPDGNYIMYTIDNKKINIYNILTGESTRTFPNLGLIHNSGCFSPDGKKICYIQYSEASDDRNLFIIDFPFDEIEIDPWLINFGTVHINETYNEQFIIKNFQSDPLVINSINSDNEIFTINTESVTIAPGDSVITTLTFNPTMPGEESGKVTIQSEEDISIVYISGNVIRNIMDDPNEPMIQVLSPQEYMHYDLNYNISWNYVGIDFIKIEYSVDNGETWSVIDNNIQASDKTYVWKPPDISSDKCRIKISDANNPSLFDISEKFIIENNYTISTNLLPVINEVMLQNQSTIRDEDGDYYQWIELYNHTSFIIDMAGCGLSNDLSNPHKWVFQNIYLKPGEYKVIFFSNKNINYNEAPYLHSGFTLNTEGDSILLTNKDNNRSDRLEVEYYSNDESFGRDPNDLSVTKRFGKPTPGYLNNELVPAKPTKTQLDDTRLWLWQNPPNGQNRESRRERMTVIQDASYWTSPQTYSDFNDDWYPDRRETIRVFKERNPILYYLHEATIGALENIHNTKVFEGLVIWHIYNMGYIFKTPDSCFGIDLVVDITSDEAEPLVEDLDFLLISHEHDDHFSKQLINKMLAAQKPVVTSWYDGTIIVNKASTFQFGNVLITVDFGYQYPEDNRPVVNLLYRVDCGEAANNCTIYHNGDANHIEEYVSADGVDIFIMKLSRAPGAINLFKPHFTILSHALELQHSPNPPYAWRWSYDYALSRIEDVPMDKATVLTWGERWLTAGTRINILSPNNFSVTDHPNDNGHRLQLNWDLSPNDEYGNVLYYRIYRSRSDILTEPIPLSQFTSIDSLMAYEEHYTILIDSVAVETTDYVDEDVPLNGVTYYYWLQSVGEHGVSEKVATNILTLVEKNPLEFKLKANYPNPFNPATSIEYSIPQDGHVTLTIYNISGQRINVLKDEIQTAGNYSITWDASDMPSGLYFCNLRAGGFTETRKMMLVK